MAAFLGACSTTPAPSGPADTQPHYTGDQPPAAPREFRAAWVSVVTNIDWPSKPGLSTARQQEEAIAILDRAKAMNLNAIVLQVRTSADAIYPSKIEPWSEYLTGQQGQAPSPAYDPLQFWITQAHARGMELHAWFNPYRARHQSAKSSASRDHISVAKPQLVRQYGQYLWMDPAEDAASQQTLDVILDVVRRYDVDGVHIDDYFYPYPIPAPTASGGERAALDGATAQAELDFPDQGPWQRYVQGGGKLDRASWRRQNVDRLIEAIYTKVHREKSWVRFGVSPFGIGRPDRRPPGISGFSQYDKLYADAELWLEKGWLDYFVPQLYWPIAMQTQSFPVLMDYWRTQNPKGRHLWPGLFTSRTEDGSPKAFGPNEIEQQIDLMRQRPDVNGHVHFSMVSLMQERKGFGARLAATKYPSAALVPATPWLGSDAPAAPAPSLKRGSGGLTVSVPPVKNAVQYAVWARYGQEWRFTVAPAARSEIILADDAGVPAREVVITAVDRLGNESPRASAKL
ncbi:family 10 glycosylhydrolase [Massilia endophytica]|nr:family 10 glycosylhydrolase [Massilia endophytica]